MRSMALPFFLGVLSILVVVGGLGAIAHHLAQTTPTIAAAEEDGLAAIVEQATPEGATSEPVGPALVAGGRPPSSTRDPAARNLATLKSKDLALARAALEALRRDHRAGRLSLEDKFRIAMLVGLSPEAEAFRAHVYRDVTRREVDLRPFVGRLLARAAAKEPGAEQRVRWMLAAALSDWRYEKESKAAAEGREPSPTRPLHGMASQVRALLNDTDVDLGIRILLAARLHMLNDGALALVPQAIATAREVVAFNEALGSEAQRREKGYSPPWDDVGVSLAKLGREVMPFVLPLLSEETFALWHLGQNALAQLGSVAEADVLRALRDPNPRVRVGAAQTLRYMEGASPGRVTALTAALADESKKVSAAAAEALVGQGPAGTQAVVALIEGEPGPLRRAAIASLAYEVEDLAPEILTAVLKRFKDPSDDEVGSLLGLLDDLGGRAVPATYSILRLLAKYEADDPSRQDLLASLGFAALPWFLTALESDVEDLHHYAARGLAWGGSLGGTLRQRAQALFRDRPDAPCRVWLAAAIADERDTVALQVLDGALDAGPWETRHIAATTLGAFDSLGTRYLPRLTQTLIAANAAYYDNYESRVHGMVGMLVDIENTWKEVAKRDLEATYALLDHEDKRIRGAARAVFEYGGMAAADVALAKWPQASTRDRPQLLRLIGTLGNFALVRPILKEAMATTGKNDLAITGARLMFERAPDGADLTAAADALADAAVLVGDHAAWNALLRARDHHRGPAAITALKRHAASEDPAVRVRLAKLLTELEDR